MFPTFIWLCFMISVTALLPREVQCPEQVQVVRDGEMDISVRDGGTARMLLKDFPKFDPSQKLALAKVTLIGCRYTEAITEVLTWSPGQSLQSANISESYRDRVSLINTSNGIAVELKDVRQTDVTKDAQCVYYQFNQYRGHGPIIKLHIVEPSYNLKVTRKDAHGYVHLEWTAGFFDGQDTTYTVQYRKMGGEWVNATDHEPPKNNYPNYTDIVHLSEKGNYSIRVRAANGIEPLAFSNITNVTIEDDTTLSGLLPITNWDYSEDLLTLTSPLAEQLSSAVISELDKIFNNIIGYQKSETKVGGFKDIGGTCMNAGDVMVEFHITVAESEITSAQSAFRSSILRHERLGEFNIDKFRARMGVVKPNGAPEPPYNLEVTEKNIQGYVHLWWTVGFNDGQDTTYTVQYRKMGGEWVNWPEVSSRRHQHYTLSDIVKLPGKAKYSIRIRAASGIGPPAYSNITNVTIEDADLSVTALWLYRGQNWLLFIQTAVVAIVEICPLTQQWNRIFTFLGPVISPYCTVIIQIVIYCGPVTLPLYTVVILFVIYSQYGSIQDGDYLASFIVSVMVLFYGAVYCLCSLKKAFKRLPIVGLVLSCASAIIDLGYDTTTGHTKPIWYPTVPAICTSFVLGAIYFLTAFLWYQILMLQGQDAPIARDDQPPAPAAAEGETLMEVQTSTV